MTRYLYANNATTTLAQSVSATTTIINVASGEGDLFPNPGAGEAFAITFVDAATGLQNEIAYCTARSGDALTVVRGQENKNAREWAAGDTVANYITAGVIESWLQEADLDGYATQAWVGDNFLALSDTEAQTVTGPVTFGGNNSHSGSETFSGAVEFTGDNTHSGKETFSGETVVPSVTAFTGADALNAVTAEGRYIKSIPVSPNKRITDIWENADGRAVFGDGTVAPVMANLTDVTTAGAITGGTYTKTPLNDGSGQSVLTQEFTVSSYHGATISFPIAYASAPSVGLSSEDASNGLSVIANIVRNTVTKSGFVLHSSWIKGGTEGIQGELTNYSVKASGLVS